MADKRIYQLPDATVTTGKYIAIDKAGNSEAERILFSSIFSNFVRCDTISIASGEVVVSFSTPFNAGTDYTFTSNPLAGLTADGDTIHSYPYDISISGFKVNFDVPVTLSYTAIVKI